LHPTVAASVETLTTREIEVLRLVALGRSNSQIAAELFVTVGTIKSHLHTIAGKLGASNRVEAVARGRELGLLA
jgi:LuxR family maltose regulon positive regulatory protein